MRALHHKTDTERRWALYRRGVEWSASRWLPPRGELWLVLGLAVLAVWELPRRAVDSGALWWLVAITAGCVFPLAWRQRHPVGVVVVVAVFFALYPVPDAAAPDVLVQALALLVAVYSVAAHGDLRDAVVGLVVAALAGWLRSTGLGYDAASSVTNTAWALAPWGVGRLVRTREDRASNAERTAVELQREAVAVRDRAVEAERRRIASELHDVVAHAVTVILLQARGGRRCLVDDGIEARNAFDAIEGLAREALIELRRLLAVIPADAAPPDPLPGLDAAEALVEQARAAGLDVLLEREGTAPALPPAADFSAYRVLQEGLTNALRYAGPGPSVARVSHRDTSVEIEVVNPVADAVGDGLGSGVGLTGARERVAVFGGTLSARRVGDTFVLSVSVPRQEGG